MTTLEHNISQRGENASIFEWLSWCGLTDDEEAIAHDILEENKYSDSNGIDEMMKWVGDIERMKWGKYGNGEIDRDYLLFRHHSKFGNNNTLYRFGPINCKSSRIAHTGIDEYERIKMHLCETCGQRIISCICVVNKLIKVI